VELRSLSMRIGNLRTCWVLVVMDQFTRRIMCLASTAASLTEWRCAGCSASDSRHGLPKYLSTDHGPLYRFHQWRANLRVFEITEIKTVRYLALSHPFVDD
jgi:putative transposase